MCNNWQAMRLYRRRSAILRAIRKPSAIGAVNLMGVALYRSSPWSCAATAPHRRGQRLLRTRLPHTPAKGLRAKVDIHAVGIPRFLQDQDVFFVLACYTSWGMFLGHAVLGLIPIKPYCLAVTII